MTGTSVLAQESNGNTWLKMGSFFVVWSSVNIVVERIKLDDSFGNSLRRKLVVFHHKYVRPAHFQMKILRELSPIQLSVDTDN